MKEFSRGHLQEIGRKNGTVKLNDYQLKNRFVARGSAVG